MLTAADVPGLQNGERLPIVTAFTCLAGQFGFPGEESVGEALLTSPQAGAAAIWSASGLSRNHRVRELARGFYAAIFENGATILGDALRETQSAYARAGEDRYILDIYNLLGDPATRIT